MTTTIVIQLKKIEKGQWNTVPIRVGRDCWIGSNVHDFKGVTIGDNTIIGAGCLIRNDISIKQCGL